MSTLRSNPPVPSHVVNDLFSVTPAPTTKKSKSSKTIEEISPELKVEMKLGVAVRRIVKAIEKKGDLAMMRLKRNFTQRWCSKFVKSGVPPASTQYMCEDASIDFVPTKRINIRAESVDALKMLGINIDPYLELSGVTLDIAAIEELGLMDGLKTALANIPGMNAEILGKVLVKKISAKETLYPDLVKISKESLPQDATEAQIVERMVMVTEIVNPVSQIRNPNDSDSVEDAIRFVLSVELDATPEEEQKIKAKQRFGSEE